MHCPQECGKVLDIDFLIKIVEVPRSEVDQGDSSEKLAKPECVGDDEVIPVGRLSDISSSRLSLISE